MSLSPDEARAAVKWAFEAQRKRLTAERRCRRLLAKLHPTLILRHNHRGYTVADRYSDGVPWGAPLNAEIEDIEIWLKAGAPLRGDGGAA